LIETNALPLHQPPTNVFILDFIAAEDDGVGEVTTGAVTCVKLQSNRHQQQTITQTFLQARCPSLSPNQQRHSTEVRKYHAVHGLAHPKLT